MKMFNQLIQSFNLWYKFVVNRYDRLRRKCQDKTRSRHYYHCTLEQMPEYLRFNPWILNGYRPADLSTLECFQSICSLHNETINIMTHVIPIVYIVLNYESMFNSHLFRSYLAYCHLISCLSSWIGSLCYHIFMNHRQGHHIYSRLLKTDMIGIWITQTFGALTTIQASFIAFPESLQIQSVIFYLILSLYALYKGLTAHKAWQRPFSFALLVMVRVICFIVRISTHQQKPSKFVSNDDNSSMIYIHVIGQELWPIVGAIISVLRIPERFFPGRFDLFLNSHNIMHCLVVLGGFHMHLAFLTDIQYFL